MRLHHIIIAILVSMLFAVVLYSEGSNFVYKYNPNASLIDADTQATFGPLEGLLNQTRTDLGGAARNAPGGPGSRLSDDVLTSTSETGMVVSAWNAVTSLGTILFSLPLTLLTMIASFLMIPQEFVWVASTAVLVIVAIILVSSILKNRL